MNKLMIALALIALVAAPSFAHTEQNVQVEINVSEYAELTVVDDQIILNLVDTQDKLSEFGGDGGQFARLQLQANYLTNLIVTSESGSMQTHHGYSMVLTADNGNEMGAWPQVNIGENPSGQSLFSGWDGSQLVVDGTHREQDSGNGIPAGVHDVLVGVSSTITNTGDGEWADSGTYTGELLVTVVGHQ